MGSCRLLNVALGLSAAVDPGGLASLPGAALALPIGLGLYTAVLTALARSEVDTVAPRRHTGTAAALGALAVVYVATLGASSPAGLEAPALVFYAYLLGRGFQVIAPVAP
jgi:hypothetical protein